MPRLLYSPLPRLRPLTPLQPPLNTRPLTQLSARAQVLCEDNCTLKTVIVSAAVTRSPQRNRFPRSSPSNQSRSFPTLSAKPSSSLLRSPLCFMESGANHREYVVARAWTMKVPSAAWMKLRTLVLAASSRPPERRWYLLSYLSIRYL